MNTPIKREDIRKGDVIRQTYVIDYTAEADLVADRRDGTTYELIKRPVQLPTEIGYYLNSEGDVWYRQSTGANNGNHWKNHDHQMFTDAVAARFAPFTLLRPVAEVAAEVLAEVRKSMDSRSIFFANIDALETKWATK